MKRLINTLLCSLLINTVSFAALISHTDYSSAGTITAAGQNANENTIVTAINGNLDNTNLAAGTALANLAAGSITGGAGGKIASNTITSVNLSSPSVNGSTANSGGTQGAITQGTISTPDFRANAVTQSFNSANINGTSAQATLISSTTLTTVGGKVLIIANITFNCTSGTHSAVATVDDGVNVLGVMEATCNSAANIFATGSIVAIVPQSAASHTFSLNWSNAASTTIQFSNFSVIEIRA